MKNISVSLKMSILTLLVLFGLIAVTSLVITELKNTSERMVAEQEAVIRQDYDKNIKEQVQNALSLLEKVNKMIEDGDLTRQEGEKLAASKDATDVDSLISDFSAASEELLASAESVLNAMDGINQAAEDGAKGTTDIATSAVEIKNNFNQVAEQVGRCAEIVSKLNENISVFKV